MRFTLICAAVMASAACNRPPDLHRLGEIRSPADFGMTNFVVVHVDPSGRKVTADLKAFNLNGDSLDTPWDELTLSAGDERYAITTKGVGNHQLIVNGKLYEFPIGNFDLFDGPSESLIITFGRGISQGEAPAWNKCTAADDLLSPVAPPR
jgi:hypothetical protein